MTTNNTKYLQTFIVTSLHYCSRSQWFPISSPERAIRYTRGTRENYSSHLLRYNYVTNNIERVFAIFPIHMVQHLPQTLYCAFSPFAGNRPVDAVAGWLLGLTTDNNDVTKRLTIRGTCGIININICSSNAIWRNVFVSKSDIDKWTHTQHSICTLTSVLSISDVLGVWRSTNVYTKTLERV